MRCFTPRRFCGRCCVRGEDTAPEPKKAVLADGAKWIRTFSSALGRQQFVVSSEFGRSTGARSSQQLPASANRSSCRAGSGAPSLTRPDQAASHQGRAVGSASASQNRRFESIPLQR